MGNRHFVRAARLLYHILLSHSYMDFPGLTDDLPILAHKKAIIEAISEHQALVIAGDTGSGKTTQLPQFCLALFPDEQRLIGCTQPRRVAAATVSRRVRDELGPRGALVGYKIRFQDYTGPRTRIKFMTDGVLLAEIRSDPLLSRYRVIIIDEAHERGLNIDFLIGYLKKLLPRRPDLKVIITSATIDTAAFAKHFDDAPTITIPGRVHPITVLYHPFDADKDSEAESYCEHCAQEILALAAGPPGDILAFLPTERDVRECCALVEGQARHATVLPMFGRLAAADQERVFQPVLGRKIVIATNVAETSITVPGIRYVVDSGLARISAYNARARTTSLPVRPISRAACDQRKGRCGRIGPGLCVRLYSEEDYLGRDQFTLPEIQRANLAEVILQMAAQELGGPEAFPFLDPPRSAAIRDGYRLLFELRAMDEQRRLSEDGRFMATLPIDPCIARILIEAKKRNCLRETTTIAAALAIQDPRIRPAEKEKEADAAHKIFAHPHSDFLALYNIWRRLDEGEARSWSKLKKFCKSHYLSFQRLREWFDLREQLGRILAGREGFIENSDEAAYPAIHQSLTAGLLRNIAMKKGEKKDKTYLGAGGKELMIFPGSHQFSHGGAWIVAASFLETSRLYALTVASIEAEWLEELAPHLCVYSWTNPRWQKKTGQVVADERVSLFGLVIVSARPVNYGAKGAAAQAEARAIFMQRALLDGEILGDYPFLEQNRALVAAWREREQQLRKNVLLKDDGELAALYDQRLPPEVYDRATLNRWLRREKKGEGRELLFSEADILRQSVDKDHAGNFPTTLSVRGHAIPISYHFAPGEDDDGMTFHIPLSMAPMLDPAPFEWLAPGMLAEKVTALLRGLPKNIRKRLVPLNCATERLLDDMRHGKGSLYLALQSSILKLFRLAVGRADWPENDQLPPHLSARFLLLDSDGREVAAGRDLARLLKAREAADNGQAMAAAFTETPPEVEKWRRLVTRQWDFADLPETVSILAADGSLRGLLFSCLAPTEDQGAARVEFVADLASARAMNRHGLALLYRLQFADAWRSVKKYAATAFSGPSVLALLPEAALGQATLEKLLFRLILTIFSCDDGIPASDVFQAEVARVKEAGFFALGRELCDRLLAALRLRREIAAKIAALGGKTGAAGHSGFIAEKRAMFVELLWLVAPQDLLAREEALDVTRMERQLKSLAARLERFSLNPAKDEEKGRQLTPFLPSAAHLAATLAERGRELPVEDRDLAHAYLAMVDEFRISLFSPEMKTLMPVSAKRLEKLREQLTARGLAARA
ncbi:MAG: ATP-dependent RNA helicase HrpA [Desulfobulbaceae bacterium]|jgi:ATP-dependent helicase HrpA|nr:ATP-dependent RNA helicase HrpA [Desulfobulbaceae bacterium]